MKALVAVQGALGDAVALALERDEPRWQVHRGAPPAGGESCDLVIVDEALPQTRRRDLARAVSAPLCVLGVDVPAPFSMAAIRRGAASAVARAQHRAAAGAAVPGGEIVAIDPPLLRAMRIVDAAAKREGGVLITGPTGVGKELLARRYHASSGRKGPYLAINCSAMSEGLVESTLFGHARGAFTGAHGDAKGLFAGAHGGTLFLDEIGELDLRAQAKLLRAVEEGSVRPVGSLEMIPVDVRLVAATNRDLRRESAEGRFRADLYFRLATFVAEVPELRRRPADLEALIERMLRRFDTSGCMSLSDAARARLRAHSWPGNVRELRNVIERAVALAEPPVIEEEDLEAIAPELFAESPRAEHPEETSGARCPSLAELERERIASVLEQPEISVKEAAERLGIHRSTLWRKKRRRV